ncbi:MAG: tRNA pseudouridine(38-40) synthase TruA [Ectothiorhodospiraceae bacterium]|nr:tRNA pseudouridine(38-40) synthase TruA [Ectothiorhodospiraceae bacterium]
MRIAMGIEYDGSHFCGWQAQKQDVPTVQGNLEAGLSQVANTPVNVICAGRTDAGVHGCGQVIHFDTEAQRRERSWVSGTNANMAHTVAVLWATPVDETFHARFSALRRRYRYVIATRAIRPTFAAGRVSWDHRHLDVPRMQQAAQHLLGEHDFNAYRAVACQAHNSVRTIHQLEVQRRDDLIIIDLEANAFLQHMVRNIAGVLMAIGAGEQAIDWSREVLETRDRTQGGVTAPPHGLYFMGVEYPPEYALPEASSTQLVW